MIKTQRVEFWYGSSWSGKQAKAGNYGLHYYLKWQPLAWNLAAPGLAPFSKHLKKILTIKLLWLKNWFYSNNRKISSTNIGVPTISVKKWHIARPSKKNYSGWMNDLPCPSPSIYYKTTIQPTSSDSSTGRNSSGTLILFSQRSNLTLFPTVTKLFPQTI